LGYGAQFQSDFSQVGETAQMMDILEQLGKVEHFQKRCDALSDDEKRQMALEVDDALRGKDSSISNNAETLSDHLALAWWNAMDHKEMFMGCGKLSLPSTLDYLASGMKMHMRMAFEWTGDADVDFLLGMAAHHEGAIEMCNIYYQYWSCAPERTVCKDPLPLEEVQLLMSNQESVSTLNAMHHICAGHILATQPKELAWMKAELKKLNPQALKRYEAQIGPDGEFLIDKLPCASKYLNDPTPTSSGSSSNEQCAAKGQKARSCGASSQYLQDCCPGFRCSPDNKHCIADVKADDVALAHDIATSIQKGVSPSRSKQSSKSAAGSGGGLSGVAKFFIVTITLATVLLVAAVVIRRRGGSGKEDVLPHMDPSFNLSPVGKSAGGDGEMEEVYMI
jgi:hypothetical protein